MSLNLHVETIGEGPDVVVLHGLFGAGRNWLTVARRMAGDYRFHLVDLRNHGQSPHDPSMTYLDMAADVRSMIVTSGLGRPVLVGHSMGGKAAMTLALVEPDILSHLINIDIAPVAYPDRFAEMIAGMRALDLSGIRRRKEADVALAGVIPEITVRQFVLQNLVFRDGAAAWRANLAALEDQMPHILGPLPVAAGATATLPTDFIRGELSDRIGPEHHAQMRAYFPNYRLSTVAGGGHWPQAEAPAEFERVFAAALATR